MCARVVLRGVRTMFVKGYAAKRARKMKNRSEYKPHPELLHPNLGPGPVSPFQMQLCGYAEGKVQPEGVVECFEWFGLRATGR